MLGTTSLVVSPLARGISGSICDRGSWLRLEPHDALSCHTPRARLTWRNNQRSKGKPLGETDHNSKRPQQGSPAATKGPDGAAREAIFNVHLRGLPLASDVDIADLSRLAEGYSGAEIKSICDQTCMLVQERYDDDRTANKLEMTMADLTAVLEKTPRNITKQMIDGYEKWSRQFKKV